MNTLIPQNSSEQIRKKPFIFSGSFDPWTYGHDSVVRDFFELFPERKLIIIVADNPQKKTLFSPEQRKSMIEKELQKWGARISVEIYGGVISNYAYENGAQAIIKWVRDAKDFDYELAISQANSYFSGNIKTILIPQIVSESQKVSSSVTKILQSYGADISTLVSPMVREALRMKTRGQMVVWVTWGTGSGKSTVCRDIQKFAQRKNIVVHNIDVDTLVYDLYQKPNSPLTHQIRQEMLENFPPEIIQWDETVNRRILWDIVFSDGAKKGILEGILWEAFLYMLQQRIQSIDTPGIILLDWALFVEYWKTHICDENMILVGVPEQIQKERILNRDGLTRIQAEKRMHHQISYRERKKSIAEAQSTSSERLFLETDGENQDIRGIYKTLSDKYTHIQKSFL